MGWAVVVKPLKRQQPRSSRFALLLLQNLLVEGEGFEPSKAEPSDLQSDPFGRSGTPPNETADYECIMIISQSSFG